MNPFTENIKDQIRSIERLQRQLAVAKQELDVAIWEAQQIGLITPTAMTAATDLNRTYIYRALDRMKAQAE